MFNSLRVHQPENPFNQLRYQGFRLKHRSKVVHVELFDYVARRSRGNETVSIGDHFRRYVTLRKKKKKRNVQEYNET